MSSDTSGAIAVTATKPTPTSRVGLRLGTRYDTGNHPHLCIESIHPQGPFAKYTTLLKEGFLLIEINGISTENMTTEKAAQLLRSAPKEMSVVVLPSFPAIVTVSVTKTTPDMKLGVIIRQHQSLGYNYISECKQTSPFWNQIPVGPHYRIAQINNTKFRAKSKWTPSDLVAILKSSEREVTITLKHVDTDNARSTNNTQAGGSIEGLVDLGRLVHALLT